MFLRLLIAAAWLALAGCNSQGPQGPGQGGEPELSADIASPEEDAPARPIPADTLYDLLVAEMAGHQSNYELALENYVYQARETRDVQVTARAAQLAQFLGATDVVEEMASLWLELEPKSGEAHFIYGLALARQGSLEQAFREMELARAYGGQVAFTAVAAESLQHSTEQQQALLGEIDRALQAEPANTELLMAKSIVQQNEDKEAALVTARLARAAAGDDAQPIILEATLLQQMERGDEAQALLKESLEQHPQNRRMRLLYARLLTQSDLPAAREQFEILAQLSPDDADLIFSLGLISRELEQFDDARRYFQQLLQMDERESEAHYYLGLIALQEDYEPQAVTHFKMVRPGQDFMPAMNQLSRIMLSQGRDAELRQFFADQRRHYPQAATPLYILEAEMLQELEQYQAADSLLTEALSRYPDDATLLYSRALIAEQQHDLTRAEADLRKIIAGDANNASALNALGYILSNHTDRYTEATGLIEQALALSPDDPTVLDSMGWVKYRVGELPLALDYLQRAYDLYPDTEIAAHLGEVLWQLGRKEQALEVWREGIARDTGHAVLLETLERFGVANQVRPPE